MLIYTSKAPGWGKQKPKQWGSLSAVRAAVHHHCERLGIDPYYLLGYWPFWQSAGAYAVNVAKAIQNPILGTPAPAWSNKGMVFNGGSSRIEVATAAWDFSKGFSFISRSRPDSTSGNKMFLAAEGSWGWFGSYSDYFQVSIAAATPNLDFGTIQIGKTYNVAATADRVRHKGFVDGVLKTENIDARTFGTTPEVYIASYDLGNPRIGFVGEYEQLLVFSIGLRDESVEIFAESPFALLQPVPQMYYFDLGAGGFTASSSTAWKIYTTQQRQSAWNILASLSSDTGWKVFDTADLITAWRTKTTADRAASWKIFDTADSTTEWKIKTTADNDTAWKVFDSKTLSTAWKAYTTAAQSTAWRILTSTGSAVNTAWEIYNATDTDTAWSIKTQAQRDTAWAIYNAGSSAVSTAWQIYNSDSLATAWAMFASADTSTSWRVFNVSDQATSWHVKTQLEQATGWQLFTSEQLQTAWALNSDTIPEPVKTFYASKRDLLFHAPSRTIIFLADNK